MPHGISRLSFGDNLLQRSNDLGVFPPRVASTFAVASLLLFQSNRPRPQVSRVQRGSLLVGMGIQTISSPFPILTMGKDC